MSDAGLLAVAPDAGGWEQWGFQHNLDHVRLAAEVNRRVPTAHLAFYLLDPFRPQEDWLLDHQRAHDDLALVLRGTGSDLQQVDFADPRQVDQWLQINWQEHAAYSDLLGI